MAYGSSSMKKPPMKKPPMKKPPMKKPPTRTKKAPMKKAVKGKLTERQMEALKRHEEHHTKKHMTMMRKLMREGMSFTQAHKMAMKNVGK